MELEDDLLNEDCQASLCGIQIDDSLEDRLKVHGISKRNVRSMIYEVFSDENVLKLLNSKESELELNLPDVRMTRSKKSRIENDSSGEQSCERAAEDCAASSSLGRENDALACFLNSESMNSFDEESQLDSGLEGFRDNNDTREELGDFDWKSWLAELTHDKPQKASNCLGDYDSDEDPDFNFLAELEEPDLEDFRNDNATRISKKELISLQNENNLVNSTGTSKFEEQFVSPKDIVNSKENEVNKKPKECDIKVYLRCKTARKKLELLKQRPVLNNLVKNKPKPRDNRIYFSSDQKEQLRQQLQQHVQLLAQNCVLALGNVNVCNEYTHSISYLQELDYFGYGCGLSQSCFQASNLKDAITLASSLEIRSLSQPVTNHKVSNFSHEQVNVICNSKVFMYKELLPNFENFLLSKTLESKFSSSEDCLIAYGLADMSGFYFSVYDLISAYILPVFTSQEIKKHVHSVLHCGSRKDLCNPIRQYKAFGVLPGACKKVKSVVPNETKKPLDMCGDLPTYVEEYKLWKYDKPNSFSNNSIAPTNVSHQEKSTMAARNIKRKCSGRVNMVWTKTLDEIILKTCKKHNGPTTKALIVLETQLQCSKTAIKRRFDELMNMYQKMINC